MPGADYQDTVADYLDLQYQKNGAFNPFVQLIHSEDYLDMSAYAFSIDDAVGNMNEPGKGLIITVGGSRGLVNKNPFNKNKIIYVNLGAPQDSGPKWKLYGVCTNTPDQDVNPHFPSFPIVTVDYPCRISLTDTNDTRYELVVRNEPPDPVIGCGSSDSPAWCQAANVSRDNKSWYINTPPPAP
ncbi:MAG: hypothetical protein GEU91_19430 [Rhizobiales bacterium]|nr:hypothetical protein [Hyphomicrobiales bacterium]